MMMMIVMNTGTAIAATCHGATPAVDDKVVAVGAHVASGHVCAYSNNYYFVLNGRSGSGGTSHGGQCSEWLHGPLPLGLFRFSHLVVIMVTSLWDRHFISIHHESE